MTTSSQTAPSTPAGFADISLHTGYVSIAEVLVDAPPRIVWPHVINTRSWIYDFHFELVSGEASGQDRVEYFWYAGAEGPDGAVNVAPEDRTADNAAVLKTMQVIPEKLWYGINPPKIKKGVQHSGVNIVHLSEEEGRTRITAIRSKEALCPTRESLQVTREEMPKAQHVAQLRWTTKYLPRLKELAEASVSTRT